jgi:hypothetical protein
MKKMAIPENAVWTVCVEHFYSEKVLAHYGIFKTAELADKYAEHLENMDMQAGFNYNVFSVWMPPHDLKGIITNEKEFMDIFYKGYSEKDKKKILQYLGGVQS